MNRELFLDRLKELYRAADQEKIETFLLAQIGEVVANRGDLGALGVLYNELGGYYRGVSRYRDSLDVFDKATACLEACGLGQSTQAATVMINRAGTCRLLGDSGAALKLYDLARTILDASPALDPYLDASLCNNLSLSYLEIGRLEEALVEAQKGYEIVKTIPDAQHAQATALVNLASISMRMGGLETAEVQMDQAMSLYENMPAPNIHYAAALNLLANIRMRQGNYDRAQEALQKALEYTLHFFGENIEASTTRQSLAYFCSILGDPAGACRWQQAALEGLERLLGTADTRSISAQKLLAQYRTQV